MAAKPNGFWDFKSYDQNTWFRSLIWAMSLLLFFYLLLHFLCYKSKSNYEYSRLNDEQKLFIGRLFSDTVAPVAAAPVTVDPVEKAKAKTLPGAAGTKPTTADTAKKDIAKKSDLTDTVPAKTCAGAKKNSERICLSKKAIAYLENIFDNKLDACQAGQIGRFLDESSPQDAVAFLSGARFRVHSYFWLIGPSIYFEVYGWAIFGVLSSLFFALGVVNSNTTTDLGNPKSQFDSSEIYGQIAKIFYAPLCTLAVVFGYNYFKDQNIVDISSGKGVLAFAFISGFYSSRIVALMDRLKEVLLPNSGSSALPAAGTSTTPIPQITLQLTPHAGLGKEMLDALGDTGMNAASIQLKATGSSNSYTATRKDADPNNTFTATAVVPGNYVITAELKHTLPDNSVLHLAATLSGQILSGNAPIVLIMKQIT